MTIQCLCHVGHLILLGIQVQASGQGLRFCDLAHTRVHLLGLDRSGLAWDPVVGEVEEREQNIKISSDKENNTSFIFISWEVIMGVICKSDENILGMKFFLWGNKVKKVL